MGPAIPKLPSTDQRGERDYDRGCADGVPGLALLRSSDINIGLFFTRRTGSALGTGGMALFDATPKDMLETSIRSPTGKKSKVGKLLTGSPHAGRMGNDA